MSLMVGAHCVVLRPGLVRKTNDTMYMLSDRQLPFGTLLLLLVVLLSAGCENTISPFSERATYSIWGYLSLARNRQFIRVKDLDRPLSPDTTDLPNLTVTLENLSARRSAVLNDSIIYFDDGTSQVATRNFWTYFPIKPDTRYRLRVEDEKGVVTEATARTPAPSQPVVKPDTGNCLTPFTIEFPGVDSTRLLENVRVKFTAGNEKFDLPEEDTGPIHLRDANSSPHHDDAFLTFEPESLLQLRFAPVDDERTECIYESLCPTMVPPEEESPPSDSGMVDPPDVDHPKYANIVVSYVHLGPEWSGSLPDDPPSTNPRNTPRIAGGRGFFGAIHRDKVKAIVDTMRDIPVDGPSYAPCGE